MSGYQAKPRASQGLSVSDLLRLENHDQYMTTQQIADAMQVCRTTVLGWIYLGELPAVNVAVQGRPIFRVRVGDWITFVASRQQSKTPESSPGVVPRS